MPLLGREELLRALRALDEELGNVGIRGEVFVVVGAAMALAYDVRRSTADVDAVFAPSAEVRNASRAVSDRLGLEADWLNDAAKAFLPGDDPDRVGVYEGPHLSDAAASPRFLLAMKLLAARVERDSDDINALYKMCGFETAEDGMDLVEKANPAAIIPPRTEFLLQELFPAREQSRARERSRRQEGSDLGL